MKNQEKYQKQFSVLSASGVGVIFTRTREPFRAIAALHEWASVRDLPFSLWNVRDGWTTRQPADTAKTKPKVDKLFDPFAALKWVLDVDNGGTNAKKNGVFVMHATHPWLNQSTPHAGIVECLRNYVRDFTENKDLRLILVSPEHAALPAELEHDIPILDFDLPDRLELREILDFVVECGAPANEEVSQLYPDEQMDSLVAASSGMTQMEAEVAFSKAIVENRPKEGKWSDIPFADFAKTVLTQKTEVVKTSEVLELMEPVSLEEVGGLDQLKEWIVVAKDGFTKAAQDFGVDTPLGICAVGPPGTGKTLIGKAIATCFGQPLIRFDVSKCFGSLVGQSESRTRAALLQIASMAPCTVLLDEIDKGLGGAHTSSGDSGVSRRVLGNILTFMQESTAQVFWIFTANRTDSLPPELLRKGRMDEVFAVLPPNRTEREAIFHIHLKKRRQDPSLIKDLDVAISASRGYVSAELEAGVKEAVKYAFHHRVKVTGKLIAEMLGNMKPLSEAFPEDFAAMSNWAENNARLASAPSSDDDDLIVTIEPPTAIRRRRRGIEG